jgi:alkanesulfonate monooxygenase SsuD/methylene tetrahydromethanopterin reductase-like flavin-dependent oxidoreductase (luciferase family)
VSAAWPGVRVGIGLVTAEVPPGSGRAPADEYSDTLRIAERAEELGFDSLWTSEHHGVARPARRCELVLRLSYPGMDLPGSVHLLELFASDVLPRLSEALINQER